MSDPLDEFELHAREWAAQERIRHHASRVTERLDLDPEYARRVEEAAESGDADELYSAVADFLEAVEDARGPS